MTPPQARAEHVQDELENINLILPKIKIANAFGKIFDLPRQQDKFQFPPTSMIKPPQHPQELVPVRPTALHPTMSPPGMNRM